MSKSMIFMRANILYLSFFLLCSCSMERTYEDQTPLVPGSDSGPRSMTSGIPNDLSKIDTSIHASVAGGSSAPMQTAKQYQASSMEEMLKLHKTENITFTDPDRPNAFIPEIHNAFMAQAAREKNWHRSYGHALRLARRSGKSILIWFHDSKVPICQQLEREVFSRRDFESWAKDNLVRLKYDKREFEVDWDSSNKDKESIEKSKYIAQAYEHFNVKGTPTIIILYPDGQRMDLIKGYKKGGRNQLLEKIMHCASIGKKKHEEMKAELTPRGYRTWTGRNKIELFAQLIKYDSQSNDLWLKEFDGTQTKVNLKNLSSEDRQFIKDRDQSSTKALR